MPPNIGYGSSFIIWWYIMVHDTPFAFAKGKKTDWEKDLT